ncbi:sensor histidine kinase [Halosimplex sp. J119]
MGTRALAVGSIGATGLLFVAGAAAAFGDAPTGNPDVAVLVALGVVLGLAILAGAAFLFRSDVRTNHTARIAGWNLLGVALLGGVLALARAGPGVTVPDYVVVDILGVSSVAHLLIGYNDVRRIRAEELARQRRTLAVVNRLTRHNLRNRTQILVGHASHLADSLAEPDERSAAETMLETATELSDVHGELATIQNALNGEAPVETVELAAVVEDILAPYRDSNPDGTFETDVPDGLAVYGDEQLRTALAHLVENAVEHGNDGAPYVRVSASVDGETVRISVADRGPGLPENEVAVLTSDREISQLEHGSGLGLWVVKTVAERYGGDLSIENGGEGATVAVDVRAA